ncbi:MAG: EAL domain-containing protein [Pseudomonadota bacterium]
MLEQFVSQLFPFHVRLDQQLRIMDAGVSARKLLPNLVVGRPFTDYAKLISPRIKLDRSKLLRHLQTTFLVELNDSAIRLRGQLYLSDGDQALWFLCSPWLEDPQQLAVHGLKETDFAPHESSIEHLYMSFTRAQQLEELRAVNDRLQATIRRSEELASAESVLTRDLEIAADLRVQITDGCLESVHINATTLRFLDQYLKPGCCLQDTPEWFQRLLAQHPVDAVADSCAAKAFVVDKETTRTLDVRMSRVSDTSIILLGRDMTDAHAEYLLLLQTLERAMEAVIMVDDNDRITFFNEAAQHMFQYTADEALRQPIDLLSSRGLTPRQRASDGSWTFASEDDSQRGEVVLWRKDQTRLLCSYSISQVEVGNQAVRAAFIQDITLQREAEQRISFQANHDGLTGLPNRRHSQQHLNQQIETMGSGSLAVALIDMDNFKTINDLLGHDAGDSFLKSTAQRMLDAIREEDFACRLGGDEFALILSSVGDRESVEPVIQRVTRALAEPLVIDDVQWEPGASVGVALGSDGNDGPDLLRHADLAMYEAKSLGKGKAVFYEPSMTERAQQRISLQKKLERALDAGEIVPFFQPIVDLETNRPVGFEALARWLSADGALIPPNDFIPIAESSDLIIRIEEQVIEQALSMVARLRHQHLEYQDISVSVNISARHFTSPQLLPMIARHLAAQLLPASALVVELTESILLDSSAAVRKKFDTLKAMGIRVALDDFGTGYSSLSYLDQYPFDMIKIDRSFIYGLNSGKVRRRLLEVMIAVGRAMQARVIAEGIEQHADEDALRELQCGYGQGYLYARPMPASELDTYLLDDVTAGFRVTPPTETSRVVG